MRFGHGIKIVKVTFFIRFVVRFAVDASVVYNKLYNQVGCGEAE